jgi:hypothetical protein
MTARERRRRLRLRRKLQVVVAPVEVGCDVIDLLVKLQWLNERDADDRQAIGRAIARGLRLSAKVPGPRLRSPD